MKKFTTALLIASLWPLTSYQSYATNKKKRAIKKQSIEKTVYDKKLQPKYSLSAKSTATIPRNERKDFSGWESINEIKLSYKIRKHKLDLKSRYTIEHKKKEWKNDRVEFDYSYPLKIANTKAKLKLRKRFYVEGAYKNSKKLKGYNRAGLSFSKMLGKVNSTIETHFAIYDQTSSADDNVNKYYFYVPVVLSYDFTSKTGMYQITEFFRSIKGSNATENYSESIDLTFALYHVFNKKVSAELYTGFGNVIASYDGRTFIDAPEKNFSLGATLSLKVF